MNTKNSEFFENFMFLKINTSKQLLYRIGCVLTLGILYVIFYWFSELHFYYYEETDYRKEECWYVGIIFKSGDRMIFNLEKQTVKWFPLKDA